MEDFLRDSAWPGLALWAALFVSDYYLTIACARMYRAQDKVVFEGSFEITPAFQADVNALRSVSPKFLVALVVYSALLWGLWRLSAWLPGMPNVYLATLGAMIGLELVVHVRHSRNWFLFSRGLRADGIRGRLEYPRAILLRMSAFELLTFAAFLSVLALLTSSWFVMGGAIGCALTGWRHLQLARRHARASATSP